MNAKRYPFEFTLVGYGITDLDEVDAEAVYAAGCGDCLVSSSDGQVRFDFARKSASLDEAVGSAVVQLKKAGVTAWLESVQSPEQVAG